MEIFLTIIFLQLCFSCVVSLILFSALWQVGQNMFLQSFGCGEPFSTFFAKIRPLTSVSAAVILEQCQRFARFATVSAGITALAKMNFFMNGELWWLVEGQSTDRTLEGFLLCVGFLMGHELCGVCELAVTYITGKKGIPQYALFILCWVARLQVTLFALVITEDYVAFDALQGELRC